MMRWKNAAFLMTSTNANVDGTVNRMTMAASASADDSDDEFDEESISIEDHNFSRDEDFQMAISAIG